MAKGQADTAEAERPETQGILDSEGEGFTFDMSGTEADDGFPVLDKGTYDASVEANAYQISQSSGHPMWAMRFLVTGPGEEVAAKKVQVRYYQSFKPEQMPRAKALLQKLGFNDLANDRTFNPKTVADDATLVGANCRLRLDVRNDPTYGRSNEVKGILPVAGGEGGSGEGGFAM
jgi:hypothetical protein